MKTIDLVFPEERMICFFCHKKLLKKPRGMAPQYDDLNLCTSAGIAVLTCGEHQLQGDRLVTAVNAFIAQYQIPAS